MTTLAVLRPTPGRASREARSAGTWPPWSRSRISDKATTLRALPCHRPMERMWRPTPSTPRATIWAGPGASANRGLVALFTEASGRLGGEDDGDEQGVGIGVDELCLGVRAGLRQGLDEAADVGARHRARFAGWPLGGGQRRGFGRHGPMHRARGGWQARMQAPDEALTGGSACMSDTVFEAMITPHRSLSRRGLYLIIAFTCTVSLGVTTLFWWLGRVADRRVQRRRGVAGGCAAARACAQCPRERVPAFKRSRVARGPYRQPRDARASTNCRPAGSTCSWKTGRAACPGCS